MVFQTNEFGVVVSTESADVNTDVKLSQVIKNKMGGESVYLNRSDGGKMLFQANKFTLPFSLNSYLAPDAPEGTAPKLSLECSFKNMDNDKKLKSFHEFLDALDEKVITAASETLLGQKKSREVVEELFKRTIKRNEKYASQIKVNINPNTKLYNSRKEEIEINEDNLPKGCEVDVIVNVGSVYMIAKRNIGISVRAEQIRVRNSGSQQKLTAYAFDDSGSDGEQEGECELDDFE